MSVPLGVDEGGLAYVASRWDSGEGSLYGAHWLDRPPLLLALFRIVAAGAEVGIRALGAVAAIGLVVLAAATARSLAGDRAASTAAILAAALAGSVVLTAAYAPAELLAAVPSAAAVLCLVRAHRTALARWLVAAGALAATAVLVKQSSVDAAAAGAAFALASPGRGGDRLRRLLALGAGMTATLSLVATGHALAGHPADALPYALVGFRIDALDALAGMDPPLGERLGRLAAPALGSALVVVLAAAVAGVAALRRDGVMAWTAAAWLATGAAAMLAGGSYWAHYLIQLVPACSVLAAVALATAAPWRRAAFGAAVVLTVAAGNVYGAVRVRERPPQALELAAAAFVRDHARPGDTQYVLYARANVLYYVDLPSPYPYAWSLMLHTIPGATDRLHRLLATPRRPTWVLQWQPFNAWGLDPHGRTRALVATHYRRVAPSLCGRPVHVWLRRDDDRAVRRRPRVCPPYPPAARSVPSARVRSAAAVRSLSAAS
ncbi:MAG TPA: glycosyltransferase family 39 protein [Solirubrobacteraceae bacterium]|nr:glycosyltransferase family 39 protein [Solirubrobacteraceae bacterium]